MSKSYLQALLLFTVALMWVLSGFVLPAKTAEDESIQTSNDVSKVKVKKFESEIRQKKISLIGTTKPSKVVDIRSEVTGKISEIIAKEGKAINKGDPILTIEKRSKQARVNELKALKDQKQISYNSAQRLAAKGLQSISKVAQTKSELENVKASLIDAQIDLSSTTIRSPFKGVLEKVYVEVGDFIQVGFGGDQAIAKVINNQPFLVVAGVSEKFASFLEEGNDAKVILATGEETIGKVTYVSKIAKEETRTFDTEITVYNESISAPAGITASIELDLDKVKSHKISSSSLAIDKDGRFGVKLIDNAKKISENEYEGTVIFQPIDIADSDESGIWVKGLPTEIMLITLGQNFVKVGSKTIGVVDSPSPKNNSQ